MTNVQMIHAVSENTGKIIINKFYYVLEQNTDLKIIQRVNR